MSAVRLKPLFPARKFFLYSNALLTVIYSVSDLNMLSLPLLGFGNGTAIVTALSVRRVL